MDGAVAGTVAAFGGIDVVARQRRRRQQRHGRDQPAPRRSLRTIEINVNGVVRTVRAALPTSPSAAAT